MAEVIALGEILIDMVATAPNVSLFDAPSFAPKAGGAPANVAVGVQRAGRSAAFIGMVGADEFGDGLRRTLASEGVDVRYLLTDPLGQTTLALVSLTDSGSPHFLFLASAHTRLALSDINVDFLQSASIFHCNSVSLAHEPVGSTTLAALHLARAAGLLCSYDVNWRPALWPDHALGLAAAAAPLQFTDVVKMNGEELALITGMHDAVAGLRQLVTPAQLVTVTLGSQGCLYRFHDKLYHQSALPHLHVVDTTGAGDAFMGALLAVLPAKLDELTPTALNVMIRRASIAGSLATLQRGAIPSLPTAAAIDAHMDALVAGEQVVG